MRRQPTTPRPRTTPDTSEAPLDQVSEGYKAMQACRVIKTLLRP